MAKKKLKILEFYCTECGCVQEPTKENDNWKAYSPICQNCGVKGKINLRPVERKGMK